MNIDLNKIRQGALYVALCLALVLFALDRTAAYFHVPGPDSKDVVIYTTAWCPYCKRLRTYLDDNEIPYKEYDVEKSFQGGMGYWALKGKGVPIAVIGPDIIYGLNKEQIERSLNNLGYGLNAMQDNTAPGLTPQSSAF